MAEENFYLLAVGERRGAEASVVPSVACPP